MDEKNTTQTPPESSQIDRFLGDIYVKAVTEINDELSGKRPFKCGWFERKVKGASMEDENRSDDEEVDIIIKGGSEFSGTWGEAKKWLAENESLNTILP